MARLNGRWTGLAAAMLMCGTAAACANAAASAGGGSGGSGGGGTVTIGESTTLSGSIASLGQTGLQGVQLAAADINAKGGLLGKQVKVVSADDAATPATGVSNVRTMLDADHAVAIFGPVASSVASAEEQVTNAQQIPIFMHTSNDIGLTTTTFSKYVFQNVPNTVMEPRAAADYLASQLKGKSVSIATFAPNYSFGQDTVAGFIQALKAENVHYTLVKQEFPPLGATDISSYLAAIESAQPDYVFNAQFGGDLVAFTKQAATYGLFAKTKVIAMYDYSVLQSLGAAAPTGAIGFDRAPYWTNTSSTMTAFVNEFRAKYGDAPSEWAILGYAAVQQWAWGVQHANSFSGDAVSAALAGASPTTILGSQQIRACDHQTELPEYVGTVSGQAGSSSDSTHLWDASAFQAPFDQIDYSCAQMQALQK
ncbi:MAG TPA: ABC transporter substrate-binding protein [Actinospica sp.]|jgi:branched-chain amino acid transport system substrate-binding protein|nr:ABC transporter substrate-binding protein [Actinospica sp.]